MTFAATPQRPTIVRPRNGALRISVGTRLSEREIEQLDELAARAGVTRSALLAKLVRAEYARLHLEDN
jgi:hypothetical protein